MSEETNTLNFLRIPSHWGSPLYRLGQMVKQGRIIGIEYQPPGTRRAYDLGVEWNYTVLPDDQEYDTDSIRESDIRLLTASDLLLEIEHEKQCVKTHQENLSILNEQLAKLQP